MNTNRNTNGRAFRIITALLLAIFAIAMVVTSAFTPNTTHALKVVDSTKYQDSSLFCNAVHVPHYCSLGSGTTVAHTYAHARDGFNSSVASSSTSVTTNDDNNVVVVVPTTVVIVPPVVVVIVPPVVVPPVTHTCNHANPGNKKCKGNAGEDPNNKGTMPTDSTDGNGTTGNSGTNNNSNAGGNGNGNGGNGNGHNKP